MSHDRPGYVSPYRERHKAITANLTYEMYEKLCHIAKCKGMAPSTLAAMIVIEKICEISGQS